MELTVPLADRAKRLVELSPLTMSQAPDAAPDFAREAAIAALARGETHYTDRPGILPLRKKVAEMLLKRFGLDVEPGNIVITCGDTEARFVSLQCLLAPGDALLALDHKEALEPALIVRDARLANTNEDFKLLYLRSDSDAAERDYYLQKAKMSKSWILFELGNDDSFHPAQDPELKDNVVTIGAIGKAQGLESWRIGFLHAPKGEAPELRSFKQALTICTTSLSQYAALALMEAS